jgi:hypothetical protein
MVTADTYGSGPAAERRVIDLATRIQRRRDFTAHLIGYAAGLTVLTVTVLAGANRATTAVTVALAWATALSFQPVRHVLRGPVTPGDLTAEAARLTVTSRPTAPATHPSLPAGA